MGRRLRKALRAGVPVVLMRNGIKTERLSPGGQAGLHTDPASVGVGGRQPPHLDRFWLRPLLECLRCCDGNARLRHVLRCQDQQSPAISGAAKSGSWNTRGAPDKVTSKLAALHFYQLAIPAPKPPDGSFNKGAAERGKEVFNGKGKCSGCHVPPLFTEPGNNLHAPSEVGVDSFQADRSPTHMYRTSPLAGLWSHANGGFYHDGRFATLQDVVEHYNGVFHLGLSESEKSALVEYLKSL